MTEVMYEPWEQEYVEWCRTQALDPIEPESSLLYEQAFRAQAPESYDHYMQAMDEMAEVERDPASDEDRYVELDDDYDR